MQTPDSIAKIQNPILRGFNPDPSICRVGDDVYIATSTFEWGQGLVQYASANCAGAGTVLPVDSEHNAIYQCFDFARPERVRRIILTASGGPFRDWTAEAMRGVTVEQAVAHPNWSMGAKISVDSATMMNKGLELIEAARLFPVDNDRIEVILHRQSVIHSMVEYVDGSILAQLGPSDMRVPIAHTLAWPDRMETPMGPLDFVGIGRLDFEAPDAERFPALTLARAALEAGEVSWLATAAMRIELARVLGYPQIVPRLAFYGLSDADVLAQFDRHARLVEPAPKAPVTCADPDDQGFIDLAVAHRAPLLSKDRAVLTMKRRLERLGVVAASCFTPAVQPA